MAISRNYKNTVLKPLLCKSGNLCAYPGCSNPLYDEQNTNLGEICHIYPFGKDEARYDPTKSEASLNEYSNLILMCSVCHKKVDDIKLVHIHPVAWLLELKSKHENRQCIPTIAETTLERFTVQLMDQLMEKMLSIFEQKGKDPTQQIYYLRKDEKTYETWDRRSVRLGAMCMLTSYVSFIIWFVLYLWQSFKSFRGQADFDPRYSFIFVVLGLILLVYAISKDYYYHINLLLFSNSNEEMLIAGKYTFFSDNIYHRYAKTFTCGFPGCDGRVSLYKKGLLYDEGTLVLGKLQIRGRCEHNKERHTYLISGDRAYYHDFKTEEILSELRRINR